jgi:hypothetical protein
MSPRRVSQAKRPALAITLRNGLSLPLAHPIRPMHCRGRDADQDKGCTYLGIVRGAEPPLYPPTSWDELNRARFICWLCTPSPVSLASGSWQKTPQSGPMIMAGDTRRPSAAAVPPLGRRAPTHVPEEGSVTVTMREIHNN